MTSILRSILLAAVALAGAATQALTVDVPTFSDLVAKAELIARTEVVGVRSEWRNSPSGQAVIVTVVTVAVEEAFKGSPAQRFEFTQLGGQVGDRSLTIPGLPTWRTGDRDILFIAGNGRAVCPLVGIAHGRYWVVAEGGREYIARQDGAAVTVSGDLAIQGGAAVRGASTPLTVAEFGAAIRAEFARTANASASARQ